MVMVMEALCPVLNPRLLLSSMASSPAAPSSWCTIAGVLLLLLLNLRPSFAITQRQPYRPAYHFLPAQNWMNDPNGPVFYKGYYHLFYQYNPEAVYWGRIHWGHAVSRDLIHWLYLDESLKPNEWYDWNGCWSGSLTLLPGNKPAILYTGIGVANSSSSPGLLEQMQCLAYPANYSDPLLRKWVKASQNPVIRESPSYVNGTMFRDPTTGWVGRDGKWRILVGAQREQGNRGAALLYKSSDFVHWKRAKHPLHTVSGTGMWECPDFFPVDAKGSKKGLDSSVNGPSVKHVLKVSLGQTDYYAIGTYHTDTDLFTPSVPSLDVGNGFRYDHGKYYASKSFFDDKTKRRILFGWVNESSPREDDVAKGWSSIQAIPRALWLDSDSGNSLMQWPVEEVESLRGNKTSLQNVHLNIGSIKEVKMSKGASQVDVEAVFAIPEEMKNVKMIDALHDDPQRLCSNNSNNMEGSFGLYVLASKDLQERTTVYFKIFSSKGNRSAWTILLCSDQSRSSLERNLDKTSYGSFISVGKQEKTLTMRVLVDKSIVETYGQGGKSCVTARVYPRHAIDKEAHLFLFTTTIPLLVKSLSAWDMSNATFHNFSDLEELYDISS